MNKYINGLTDTVYIQSEGDWIQEFVTAGFTAEELADFVPGYYAQGLATNYADYYSYGFNENSVLTLPFVKSTEVLFYNEDALNELGVSVPETWDELWEICSLAKEKWPNSIPLGYDSEANWFITMCQQNGWDYTSTQEPYYLFNNGDTQAWLNDLKGYYEQGLFTTSQIYGGYSSNLFVNGAEYGSIFSIGSSAGARYQDPYGKFNWGVAPIPGSPQEDGTINNSVISQGPSLVMFSPNDTNASEKELMTWLFVEELMEPEFQAEFAMLSGYNSCKKSTVDIDEYKAFLESDSIVAVTACVAAEMSDRYFYSPVFVGSDIARDEVGMAFIYAITGSKTPQQALEDALKKCWYN
jgi:multiple sugar transport system substrate-binding protein